MGPGQLALGTSTCALVPMASWAADSSRPLPRAAARLSPAPVATGMPAGSPSSCAAVARRRPASAPEGSTGGRSARGRPSAATSASSQPPSAPLRSVPLASEGSLAASPVSSSRSQSLGRSAHLAAARAAGSCSASQSKAGPSQPAVGALPVTWAAPAGKRGSVAAPRVSSQSRAGRTGAPSLPVSTTPCIWPESPTPVTSARPLAGRPRTAATTARHQPSGLDSAWPGAGLRHLAGRIRLGQLGALQVEQRRLHRAGAEVDPEQHLHPLPCVTGPPPRRRLPRARATFRRSPRS